MPWDGPYSEMMEKAGFVPANHERPAFFKVELRRLFDERGVEVEGYRRVVNCDEGDGGATLAIHSDGYKLVPYEDGFGALEDALRGSTLNLDGMQVATDYANKGLRVFRQYLLPAHQVQVREGVTTALRFVMFNGYDGLTGFSGRTGAYNFVCANTSIVGTDYAGFRMRHTDGLTEKSIKDAVAKLVAGAEKQVDQMRRWVDWPKIPVTDMQAIEVCKAMPRASTALTDRLFRSYAEARDNDPTQGGANAWCLFNVLTAWATHGTAGEDAPSAQRRAEREEAVAATIEAPPFQRLLAPAAA